MAIAPSARFLHRIDGEPEVDHELRHCGSNNLSNLIMCSPSIGDCPSVCGSIDIAVLAENLWTPRGSDSHWIARSEGWTGKRRHSHASQWECDCVRTTAVKGGKAGLCCRLSDKSYDSRC